MAWRRGHERWRAVYFTLALSLLFLSSATAETLTFQEGVAGYTGTVDTFVDSLNPDTDHGTDTIVDTDNDTPTAHGLIRFDNIFGPGPGQIPLGSTITDVSLTVNVTSSSSGPANITMHRMLIPWTGNDTWNSMGNGVQADDIEAASATDSLLASPASSSVVTFDDPALIATLQAWSNGASNDGWVILNDHQNDWSFSSSEEATTSLRPQLMVTYEPNGICVTNTNDAGPGSLRQAIIDANTISGSDTISFCIPTTDSNHYYYKDDGTPSSLSLEAATTLDDASITDFDPDYPVTPRSWYRISLASALPDITETAVLDGTTQSGYVDAPIIELDGSAVTGTINGLEVTGTGVTIRGLVINLFTGSGIELSGGNNIIEGNYIGLDVSGTKDFGNDRQGIFIDDSAGNRIGGTATGAGNVISGNGWSGVSLQQGNADDNLIQGNRIGTDVTGTAAIGNSNYGVDMFNGLGPDNNLIGGSTVAARNIISGNAWECVQIKGSNTTGNQVAGNFIGTDLTGTLPIPCGLGGIVIEQGARSNTIGGVGVGEGNIIAFNSGDGVKLEDDATDFNAIQGNGIFSNSGLGIDLNEDGFTANDLGDGDNGANSRQNFPILTSANTNGVGALYVGGIINSTPSQTFRIEFFANAAVDPSGHGEGEMYLGFTDVTTDALGNSAYSAIFLATVPDGTRGRLHHRHCHRPDKQ